MLSHQAPLKVFIVDDSVLIRDRVSAMLEASGMNVVGCAATPRDAIEGILTAAPDAVVLDVQLEGGSGLQVLRAIRRTAPDIAFVMFSSSSGPAYRKRYFGEGAEAFLDKSTEFEQLVQTLAKVSRYVAC